MKKKCYFIMVLLLIFTILTMGCSAQIDEEKAKEIALDDVSTFKPNNSDFEIYSIERKKMSYRGSKELYDSWVIIISSKEENAEQSSPNIFYQINVKDGTIIDKTDHAFGE